MADYDPFAPETLESPYRFYAALHAEAPVYMVPGRNLAIVSTFDLIHEVVRDTATFSSAMPTGPVNLVRAQSEDPELKALRAEQLQQVPTLLSADPPRHGRYRSLVNKAFAARRVAGMEDYIREIVTAAIDAFIADGRVELASQFAEKLPLAVIADQIGVSRDELAEFKRRADVAVGGIDRKIPPEQELAAARAGVELQRYFLARAAERRRQPRDDMLTVLATSLLESENGPRPLNDREILSILNQFQVAGKETTAHAIGMTMLLLLEHPDQMAAVRRDPSLIPNMIEEALRLETPVRNLFRTTTREVELGGVTLPRGTVVLLSFAAANRDESAFPDAERFDICREEAHQQLAFSAGEHYCVGAALARMELRVAFEELLRRLDNIRLDPAHPLPPRHVPSYILRGLTELHLRFDAAR